MSNGDVQLEPRKDWHLEKGVSLAHILSSLGIGITLVVGYGSLTARLAVLESQQSQFNGAIIQLLNNQAITDKRQDEAISGIGTRAREDQREILSQMSRISERVMQLGYTESLRKGGQPRD